MLQSGWGKYIIEKDFSCLFYLKNITFNTPVAGTFSFYPGLHRYFWWRQKNPGSSLLFSTTRCIQDPRSCQNRWKLFSITLRQNQYTILSLFIWCTSVCCAHWLHVLSISQDLIKLTTEAETLIMSPSADYFFCTVQPVIYSTHFN